MGDNIGSNNKRSRDEPADFPEAKRIKELLEDDDGVVDSEKPVNHLDDVIKSLEEEIKGSAKMDLGFLLEASDDELGLPPAVGSESSSLMDGGDLVGGVGGWSGFDRIWGLEDEILDPYAGLGFFRIDEDERDILENGDLYAGGLFD